MSSNTANALINFVVELIFLSEFLDVAVQAHMGVGRSKKLDGKVAGVDSSGQMT